MAEDLQSSFADLAVNEAKEWFETYLLGKIVRVTLRDGRIIIGQVSCVLAKAGLYLSDADECIAEIPLGRYLDQVIVRETDICQLEVK